MKSLLLKDMYLSRQLTKLILIVAVISIFLLATDPSQIYFISGYITLICSTFAVNTLSYDEHNNNMSYLMTLPIRRRDFVYEKYAFGAFSVFAGWLASAVLGTVFSAIKRSPVAWPEYGIAMLLMLAIGLLLLALSLPTQLKLGAEKGRLVLIVFAAFIFFLIYALSKLKGLIALVPSGPSLCFAGIGAAALILLLSIRISVHIMEKKEF